VCVLFNDTATTENFFRLFAKAERLRCG
jgi:hypothetical protein